MVPIQGSPIILTRLYMQDLRSYSSHKKEHCYKIFSKITYSSKRIFAINSVSIYHFGSSSIITHRFANQTNCSYKDHLGELSCCIFIQINSSVTQFKKPYNFSQTLFESDIWVNRNIKSSKSGTMVASENGNGRMIEITGTDRSCGQCGIRQVIATLHTSDVCGWQKSKD